MAAKTSLAGWALCAGLLTVCLPAPVQAQDGEEERADEERSPEDRRRERLRRWQERQQSGGGDMGGEWTNRAADFLKEELDLDDEQAGKVGAIFRDAMGGMMRRMADAWGDEGPDQDSMRSSMEDMRLELSGKIREVLTEAQAREFDALVDQFDSRAQRWEQSARSWDDPTLLYEPAPISKRILLEKAERALFLGPDETAVVMPMVERVIDLRIQSHEGKLVHRKDLRNAVDGDADSKEVIDRLEEIRNREEHRIQELIAAQQELRQLLTLEQEVRFVAMGILD